MPTETSPSKSYTPAHVGDVRPWVALHVFRDACEVHVIGQLQLTQTDP